MCSSDLGDLRETIPEPVVLFRESHPAIKFDLDMPSSAVPGLADRRLLGQAVTNLVKNASEAIDAMANSPEKPQGYRGRIEVRLTRGYDRAVIEVIDNGVGLPKQNRAKLLEPYVTTRAKGTGLGLAIVQKIVEQHRGTLTLEDAPLAPDRPRGALMRLSLPMQPMEEYRPALAPQPEPVEEDSNDHSLSRAKPEGAKPEGTKPDEKQHNGMEPLPKPPSSLTTPSVSPTLLKNSDRVMPRPAGKPAGRIQGAR